MTRGERAVRTLWPDTKTFNTSWGRKSPLGLAKCLNTFFTGEDMPEKKIKGIQGLTISECYKTSDGEVFDKLEEAKEHQVRCNFCTALASHLETLDLSCNDKAVIVDAIMENLNGMSHLFEQYIRERNVNA